MYDDDNEKTSCAQLSSMVARPSEEGLVNFYGLR